MWDVVQPWQTSTTTVSPLLYPYMLYIPRPMGYTDVPCVLMLDAWVEEWDQTVIQGWQGGLEWRTQTLWGNSPFQILFHGIASPQTTPSPHPSPTLLPNLQFTQGISPGSTCTFHNILIQLSITPAESWVTLFVDPIHLLLPFFLTLSSTFISNPLPTLRSLIDFIPPPPKTPLSWLPLS